MSKLRYGVVGFLIIVITGTILIGDILLFMNGWPTLSQAIIYWTDKTPLVPYLVGFFMGGLSMHWFESYFLRDK